MSALMPPAGGGPILAVTTPRVPGPLAEQPLDRTRSEHTRLEAPVTEAPVAAVATGLRANARGAGPGNETEAVAGTLADLLDAGAVRDMVVERGSGRARDQAIGVDPSPVRSAAGGGAPPPLARGQGPAHPLPDAGPAGIPPAAPEWKPDAPIPPQPQVRSADSEIPVDRPLAPHVSVVREYGEMPVPGSLRPAVTVAAAAPARRPMEQAGGHAPAASQAAVTAPGPRPDSKVPVARQELPLPAPGRRVGAEPEQTGSGETASGPSSLLTPLSAPVGEPQMTADRLVTAPELREARNLPNEGDVLPRAAGVADRVTITVNDDDGQPTRIRVAVVGEQVRATIMTPDGESARQLERRMDDLTAALVRRGFAEPRVTIQHPAEAGPAWAGAANGVKTDVEVPRGTEQPAGDQRQGSGRREQERQGDGQQRHPHGRPRQRDPDDRGR